MEKKDNIQTNESENKDILNENRDGKQNDTNHSQEKSDNKDESDIQKTSKKWLSSKKDKKIEELEKQIEELKHDYLRARADYDNFRKRTQKELAEARERSITSFVIEILPAIDNFEMSLQMTENQDMFIKGVQMIHSNLLNILKENHYEEFSPKIGEEFNPHLHDPVLIEDKSKKEGTIIGILKKGYKKGDNIVRHARVQVVGPKKEDKPNQE